MSCAGTSGISRTGYQWVGRYQEGGSFAKLSEHSRRPHRSPRQTPEAVEERVVELRRRYGWGARKLAVLLEREGIRVQEWTVHRILRRQGYVQKEDSRRPALKRFEREAPNELWQMDFKGEYQYAGGWCYPLSIVDDHSAMRWGCTRSRLWSRYEPVCANFFEVYGVPVCSPWWSTTYGLTRLSVELIERNLYVSAEWGIRKLRGRWNNSNRGRPLGPVESAAGGIPGSRFGLMRRWRWRCRPRVTNPAEKPTRLGPESGNTPLAAWSRD